MNEERQIATVGLCLRKIKDFLDDPTDEKKKEKANTAHEHLDLLFGGDYVVTRGCGARRPKID
jgi:hypothetical protein